MTKISFFRRGAVRPTEEQRLLTRQFYQSASAIYSSYNDWKDDDSVYFIPLYLEMTYSIGGKVLEIAPDPVWMGYESVTGWRARATVLRAQISRDRRRYLLYRALRPMTALLSRLKR